MARVDELGEFGRFGECGGMPPRPPVLAMLAVLACARAHQKLARAFAVSTASSMTAAQRSRLRRHLLIDVLRVGQVVR